MRVWERRSQAGTGAAAPLFPGLIRGNNPHGNQHLKAVFHTHIQDFQAIAGNDQQEAGGGIANRGTQYKFQRLDGDFVQSNMYCVARFLIPAITL